MTSHIRPVVVLFTVFTVLTGIVYPLVVTGFAQAVFREKANGSILTRDGKAIGSSLLGQEFSGDPKYFWGRLSATGPVPYTSFNADKSAGSSGSNLGPTNPALVDNVKARVEALRAADAAVGYLRPSGQSVPIDLVTASGSGLDPHISLAAADYQVPRVARSRALTEDRVRDLLRHATSGRQLGVLGEPVVNVLEVNLTLDSAGR